uniref:Uncharacterized protein n=1 Tax=Malurus cyaneus samueli TaxID=2593467 RepID=A0A8C5U2Y8_9PASS
MSTGQRDSKQINELCSLSDEIREPASAALGICSSNEKTEDIFCRFVNLLQNKFSTKPGIISADMPCGEQVSENLCDAHKYNSVIPVRLLNNSLLWEKIPFALQAINMLEEDSHDSAKQVEKIFQASTYRQQQEVQREKLECL